MDNTTLRNNFLRNIIDMRSTNTQDERTLRKACLSIKPNVSHDHSMERHSIIKLPKLIYCEFKRVSRWPIKDFRVLMTACNQNNRMTLYGVTPQRVIRLFWLQ